MSPAIAPAGHPDPLSYPAALAAGLAIHDDAGGTERAVAVAAYRACLKASADGLSRAFLGARVSAATLVRRRSEIVDTILVHSWNRHVRGVCRGDDAALVAVGGYGRGELHPNSDVDILVLLCAPPSAELEAALGALVTFLWDVGLEIGQTVRTVAQCEEQAARDVTIATNLMEARLLLGNQALFAEMRERTSGQRVWSSRAFFEAKSDEQLKRHHRFEDTAYRLEPNVKEGPGGLRDIQTIGWVAKRHFGAETLHELVDHEFLTEDEYGSLVEGQDFLWQVRFALHVLAGRREDRLLFDHQREVARIFGFQDDNANLAVEQFMKLYYRAIMDLSRLNEMLLELFQEAILLAGAPTDVQPINRRFQSVNGYLEVTGPRVFQHYPFALLEMFLIIQQHPEIQGVRATTIRATRAHRFLIDDAFRADIRARSLFTEILRQPSGITHELRRMNRYGILGEYLPEFGAVVGQMQYDLFHAYTVDEHSLFVVSNLRKFAVPERRANHPLAAEVFSHLAKPELLYIAGLYHDIAKGRGGDHSELGADLALSFCRDHGFGEYDSRLVTWLVRNHLLMSTTAQRKDVSDPEIIREFATAVRDRAHLDYLYLLTIADIRGTNPNLWNDWKATLLRELYLSTTRALRRGLENPLDRAELIAETQDAARAALFAVKGWKPDRMATADRLWLALGGDYFLRYSAGEIAWHTRGILEASAGDLPLVLLRKVNDTTEIFVYAPDQQHLFAATTTILGRLGLNIVDSRIITAENAMTLDSYVVLDRDATANTTARYDRIRSALHDALLYPGATRDQIDNRLQRRQLRHFETPTRIDFAHDEHNARTVMELIAADRPGLLARVGWALADCDVRLQNAKIATFGERAEDVFFVTDNANRALTHERAAALSRTLHEALAESGSATAGAGRG